MSKKISLVFMLGVCLSLCGFTFKDEPLNKVININKRYIDIRDLLEQLSRKAQISLLVSSRVKGNIDEIKGITVQEILDKTLVPRGYSWKFFEGCLYVGEPANLKSLWDRLKIPILPKAVHGTCLSADFKNADLPTLARIVKKYAGIEIRVDDDVSGSMIVMIDNMPWERLLLGLIHLNGLKIIESEFSVILTP